MKKQKLELNVDFQDQSNDEWKQASQNRKASKAMRNKRKNKREQWQALA